jgi:hypothetical protein
MKAEVREKGERENQSMRLSHSTMVGLFSSFIPQPS